MSDRIEFPIPPNYTITAEMKRNLFLDLIAESRGEFVEQELFLIPTSIKVKEFTYTP